MKISTSSYVPPKPLFFSASLSCLSTDCSTDYCKCVVIWSSSSSLCWCSDLISRYLFSVLFFSACSRACFYIIFFCLRNSSRSNWELRASLIISSFSLRSVSIRSKISLTISIWLSMMNLKYFYRMKSSLIDISIWLINLFCQSSRSSSLIEITGGLNGFPIHLKFFKASCIARGSGLNEVSFNFYSLDVCRVIPFRSLLFAVLGTPPN